MLYGVQPCINQLSLHLQMLDDCNGACQLGTCCPNGRVRPGRRVTGTHGKGSKAERGRGDVPKCLVAVT